MTVYIDVLFALNTAINYLLLRGSAAMGGCAAGRLRLLGAACLGGLYAAASVIPGLDRLASPLFQLLFAAFMMLIAFGFHKTTCKQTLFFLALSFAFGGAVLLGIFEWNNPQTIGNMSFGNKIINCLFFIKR